MTNETIRAILSLSPRIAVLGISDNPDKPAHYVPAYLHQHGYQIFGVNPKLVRHRLFGNPVVASLGELQQPVDLVDVFRRPELLPMHEAELIALRAPVVWFQLGIRNDEVAAALTEHGCTVVQNRCTLADHRTFGLGRPTVTTQ
jgi:uncharacterized protein